MVMDYYSVSMAEEDGVYLVDGMRDIKTLRIEKKNAGVNLLESQGLLGLNHFENHTYVHVDKTQKVLLKPSLDTKYKTQAHLISSNAEVNKKSLIGNGLSLEFEGHVVLKLEINVPPKCRLKSSIKAEKTQNGSLVRLEYKKAKRVKIDVICKK